MTTYVGYSGNVKIGTYAVGEVDHWTLDTASDMLEITDFESSGNREYTPGLFGWSGSLSGRWDMADARQLAIQSAHTGRTTIAIILKTSSALNYNGTCYIESLSSDVAVDGMAEVTINFRGSGGLNYSTS